MHGDVLVQNAEMQIVSKFPSSWGPGGLLTGASQQSIKNCTHLYLCLIWGSTLQSSATTQKETMWVSGRD